MTLSRGLIRPIKRSLVRGLVVAADTVTAASLLAAYPSGLALDFRSFTVAVKDPVTAANNKNNAALSSWLTTTRASTGWYFNSAGLLVSASNNIARGPHYDPITRVALGLLTETSRTNVVLRNRDLTNAVWTASNVTPLKNQVGLDGAANSASSITATAGNGTILQAITLASSARYQSAFVKRLVGAGTLEMTMDNGTTWTAITPSGTGWNVKEIATQTLANPTVGFRIGTNGDSFAIDLVQNENGADRTTPIPTAGATVTRAVDVHTVALSAFPFDVTKGTIYCEGVSGGLNNTQRTFFQIDDGSNNNRFLGCLSTLGGGQFLITDATVNVANILPGVAVPGQLQRMMATWNTATPRAQAALDGVNGTQDVTVTPPDNPTTLRLGGALTATGPYQGAQGQFIYVPQ